MEGEILSRKTNDSRAKSREIRHNRASDVTWTRTPASLDNSMNLETLAGNRALALSLRLVPRPVIVLSVSLTVVELNLEWL